MNQPLTDAPPDVDYPGRLPQYCGDLGIRIDRQGRWFYHGSPINRKEMVCLFASVLYRAKDGGYLLITPGEMGRIEVDDVPFLAVEMYTCGSGREMVVSFRTNMDEMVTVDRDHPLRIAEAEGSGEPSPYVTVRDGIEARLSRSVYYELVALGWEEELPGESGKGETVYGLWSSGSFFPLGRLDLPQ
ncbi:conserved protein of unknown function [Magnetospirillum sp. XM-1]|nr:conserved protein of unknown function [Magnetospirillum sp. XM-1]